MATFRPGFAMPSFAGDLAGGSSGKNSLYASFIAWKSAGSTRKTVVFTTLDNVRPSSSRMDAMFLKHCRVWPPTSGATHSPAFAPGRIGACAETKTNPFATTQCEYGPSGFGCFGRSGTAFMILRRPQRSVARKRFRRRETDGALPVLRFHTCKSILNSDVVDGRNPRTDSAHAVGFRMT